MTFYEFVAIKIEKLTEEMRKIDDTLSEFPKIDTFDYRSYGTRDELIRKYNISGKRTMFFRKRPSDIEIQRKVYYEELEKIRVHVRK